MEQGSYMPVGLGGVVEPGDRVASEPVGAALEDDELWSGLPGELLEVWELPKDLLVS